MKRSLPSNSGPAPKRGMSWQNVLLKSMDDPKLRIMEDDKVVVIKDAYPKVKYCSRYFGTVDVVRKLL